jgi:tetratricopeptide (TPR) repeat protein
MRRICMLAASSALLIGCSRQDPAPDAAHPVTNQVVQNPGLPAAAQPVTIGFGDQPDTPVATNAPLDTPAKACPDAGQLTPADAPVNLAPPDLEEARPIAAADTQAQKKADDQMRIADFNRLFAQGQAAMAARRYDEAVKAFTDADYVLPGNAAAAGLLAQARKARDDAQVARDQAVMQTAEERQRAADFKRLANEGPPPVVTVPPAYTQKMQQAVAFEKQQRFGDAVKSYQDALVLVPRDAKATEGMRKADFAQHYAEGQRLMTLRRYLDAGHEFEIALQRDPGNQFATAALEKARESR